MKDSLSAQDQQALLCFDKKFSQSIFVYAEESLGRFSKFGGMDHVNQLLATWDDVSDLYAQNLIDVYELVNTTDVIHGDLTLANIRLNEKDGHRLKIQRLGMGWYRRMVVRSGSRYTLNTASEQLEQCTPSAPMGQI